MGIDPDPAHLPVAFSQGEEGLRRWCELLISATADHAAAYKMNLAFFEAYGSGGMRVAESIRTLLPSDTPLIIDVKRGDIGSTVAAQARALYDVLGADAVTANPYLGIGALEPLLTREDRFVYLLCRTSNPEAPELQELRVAADGSAPEEALYLRVARLAAARPEAHAGRIGLVAGATAAARGTRSGTRGRPSPQSAPRPRQQSSAPARRRRAVRCACLLAQVRKKRTWPNPPMATPPPKHY